MSGGWGSGSTRRWRKTRKAVLERDRYRCQLRLDGCRVYADCVHHVRGKRFGDDPADLLASCTPCNLAIGDPATADPAPRPRTAW